MTSKDADRAGINLHDHVEAAVAVVDSVHASEGTVVLVGPLWWWRDRSRGRRGAAERVHRVVYVDSWPLGEVGVINDGFPAENGEVPLPDRSVFVNPTAIGAGMPVFLDVGAYQRLRLVAARSFDSGITASRLEQNHV